MDEILKIMEETGALIEGGHFVYTSRKHGSVYINKYAIYPDTNAISYLCREMALLFEHDNVEVVIGPAKGGIILSQWVAFHLSKNCGEKVLAVYAEKSSEGNNFEINRVYDKIIKNKRVLIVEDVVNTGGSLKKVIEAVRDIGGKPMWAVSLCNRGSIVARNLSIPFFIALLNLPLEAWEEKDCPLCKQNIPINTDVGKGKEFLANKK